MIFYGNFAKVYHSEFVKAIDRRGLVSVNYLRLEVPDFRKLIRPGLDGPAGIPESSRGSTCGPDRWTRRMSGPYLHRSCLVCNGMDRLVFTYRRFAENASTFYGVNRGRGHGG